MEIENNKSDYLAFYKLYYLNNFKKLSFGVFPLILIVAYNICIKDFELWYYIITCFVLIAISFLVLFGLPFLFFTVKLNMTTSNDAISFDKKLLVITEDGIGVDSHSNKIFLKWKNILAVNKIGNFIYLLLSEKKIILIPDRFFSSVNEKESFFSNIERKIQSENTIGHIKKAKSIYTWGYLGLIPIVGFFVGLALIIRGIFQYKDAKLILIGIGGILFTTVLYSFLIYQTEFSDTSKENRKNISKANLNRLVKQIEFYKLKNNIYPDSLEQINTADEFLFIYDPLFFKTSKESDIKYYYKKIDEKYTLFSIGIDTLPNTSDDIYPDVLDSNSNKLGLIKNN